MTDELMYTIPLRETVAGEALSMLCGSNTTLHWGDMGMRSPLASVSVLLSSSTLFRFSIHMASTGPSRTIQICSPTTLGREKVQYALSHGQNLVCEARIRTMGSNIRNQKRELLEGSRRHVPKFFKINWIRILSSHALPDYLCFFDLYATNDSMRFIRKTRNVIDHNFEFSVSSKIVALKTEFYRVSLHLEWIYAQIPFLSIFSFSNFRHLPASFREYFTWGRSKTCIIVSSDLVFNGNLRE